ncbi:LysR family transcriptional regulator [Paralcaligenes sp. KSB-10]|uniref:LysR family transcriptional regulator n=1 Tax=Paralcaligenes sp. KSB-10 TaxID=2901142 RepID=UPI001E4AFAB9|nr:LysR family transcriptional regulator [Paralcaligenes sp. KSB-10]UHL64428.1 LysR family transcriptional regulator [Paralcaligenes sp. KSB-10]
MARRIDPYSLRLFVTTAAEGSIARAAARENIAPSALSRRIADLEHAFGVKLLVRSPKGIELTRAGAVVRERGQLIDKDLQALAREVLELDGQISGVVRLFANMSSMIGFLPERLKAFSASHPSVQITLAERDTRDVVRACLDDEADIGVCVKTDSSAGLESWPFANDPLIVVLPGEHPLSKANRLDFAKTMQYPLIWVHPGGALDTLLTAHTAKIDNQFKPAVVVSSFDIACRMIEVGLGIAIMPQSAVTAYAGSRKFVRRPLAETWASRELCIYALRKSPRHRAVQELIEALKD